MDQKLIDKITKIQEEIVEVKRKKNKLEGSLEEQYKTLHKAYGVKTVEQGEEKISKLKKEINKLTVQLEDSYEVIQKKYNW